MKRELMRTNLNDVEAVWAQLGAGLIGATSDSDAAAVSDDVFDDGVDLEMLLLQTARCIAASPRLYAVAMTWLSRYGSLIAEHRLYSFVRAGMLEDEFVPALGLLLEDALTHTRVHDRTRNLERTMQICSPATNARPLFDVDAMSKRAVTRAERRATSLSRKWGLWCEEIAPKYDALRPAWWIVQENPSLQQRADFRGDLRCTIMLVLQEDPDAAASVSELARRCHASRPAVVRALQDLEWGHVRRRQVGAARELVVAA